MAQENNSISNDNERVRFVFEKFEPGREACEYYIKRFEIKLELHGLASSTVEINEKKKELLVSRVGAEVFKVLVDYFKPDLVQQKGYGQIKEALNNHYGVKTYVLSERVAFANRYRKEDETVTQFLSALRALAGNCAFGSSLNERLRDQLVVEINNPTWQRELIKTHPENDATLDNVKNSALILEQAQQKSKRLATYASGDSQTNRITKYNRTIP